jgi:hypothetical protein
MRFEMGRLRAPFLFAALLRQRLQHSSHNAALQHSDWSIAIAV